MKNFLLATRPKTLVAALIPPVMSFQLARLFQSHVDFYILICCTFSALFIQIATNFFNDLIDFQKGADKVRHGPMRVTSSGLVTPKTIEQWARYSLILAVIFSLPLIEKGGIIIFIPGLLSLYLTYGYTGGPYPLAYKGLGEIFVFLFFGLFSVMGSFYLYTGYINQDAFILSCIYGLLTMTLICINNLRDRDEDKKVNKMTLATRVSEKSYQILTLLTVFIPYALALYFLTLKHFWPLLMALIIALKLAMIVIKERKEKLNEGLKFAGIHLIIFSLLFYLCVNYENIIS